MGQPSAPDRLGPAEVGRLFRQDRLIAANTIRATFASWHDRIIAALLLLGVLAVIRARFADFAWASAAWATLVASTMIGIGAGRLVASRLAFHAFDGILPSDALHPQARKSYVVAWHGVGLALLAVGMLIVHPKLLPVSVAAYVAGAVVAKLTGACPMPSHIAGAVRLRWTIREWSQRPIAGIAAATVLLLSLLPARALGANALMAIVSIETVFLALLLTSVDDAIVRFMTMVGHRSRRVIIHHATGLMSYVSFAVPACWVMIGPTAAGIVAASSAAMQLLLTLRVLAYRLHPRRFADLLITIFAGSLMLVAYSMPIALPVIAVAMLWRLQRSARVRTWLLA